MKSDRYYRADLRICPWLRGTLIGEILNIKHVVCLETATYANGNVRLHIKTERNKYADPSYGVRAAAVESCDYAGLENARIEVV